MTDFKNSDKHYYITGDIQSARDDGVTGVFICFLMVFFIRTENLKYVCTIN